MHGAYATWAFASVQRVYFGIRIATYLETQRGPRPGWSSAQVMTRYPCHSGSQWNYHSLQLYHTLRCQVLQNARYGKKTVGGEPAVATGLGW